MNKKFNESYQALKTFLSDSLNADNTEQITSLTKHLDAMNQLMEDEEQSHLQTKNKLVDYVKNTTFNSNQIDPVGDDSPKTLKEAQEIAMKQLLENRKKENKK